MLECIRWLAVLPVAQFMAWLGVSIGMLLFLHPSVTGPIGLVLTFLILVPSGLAYTCFGGLVAPRWRVGTATALCTYWIPFSMYRHIFGQTDPSLSMKLHAAGECLGALAGIGLVYLIEARRLVQVTSQVEVPAEPSDASDEAWKSMDSKGEELFE